ncbi:MAG TPA: TlpA disulfide reductase family protein [Bryobacteraceae bacterium]|nr:TlpA disulfide reductase family protein [Bryobacteraceae bacterium]
MRKLILLAALAASVSGLLLFGATVPRKAPEFVFKMTDGTQQLLSQYRGKTIVLAFMYTTCPHCQHTAQVLTKVQTEYKDRGVQVLGACFDDGAAFRTQQFNTQLGLNFPVGISSPGPVLEFVQHPASEPYFVPILVFIDKTGMIRSQYIGDEKFLNQQETNIRLELDKMLKAPAAAPKAAPKS